jgi:hypothetical protein
MALDYLTIPGAYYPITSILNFYLLVLTFYLATSVGVERTFSEGRLLLSHVRSRLSVQSTQALLCLGGWSLQRYVKDSDVKAVTALDEVFCNEEEILEADWDSMQLD